MSVGFVGLGNMGQGMADNLLANEEVKKAYLGIEVELV